MYYIYTVKWDKSVSKPFKTVLRRLTPINAAVINSCAVFDPYKRRSY
jgi:hypothetical protein